MSVSVSSVTRGKIPMNQTMTIGSNSSNNKGLRRRLMSGFGATALTPVVTALVQLGSVPILLNAWGAAKYGDWLLLSAIPSYLALSDLGFGSASGSDMSMRVAAGDREGALQTFQSSWVLVTSVSLAALFFAFISVWWVPWQPLLRLSSVSNFQAATIMIVLGAYIVVCQQNGVAESGYRSDGNFATGTFWVAILRVTEAVVATAVAALGGSMLAVALTYLGIRCLGTVGYVILLYHISPWIRYGIHHARLATIRRMVAPAFGFMALPIGTSLGQQGIQLAIGVKLGPIAVVSFSTLRTLSRLNFQLISVIKNALWPELSRAFGAADISLARRLHRRACQASLGVSICGGLVLWVLGPLIYRLWIRQSIGFDATCFHVLLLVVIANSLWDTSSVIPMSVNGHFRIAVTYSVAAAFSLGIAWLLIPTLGITGAAIALLAADGWMTTLSLRTSLNYSGDTLKSFVAALFTVPRFRRTLQPSPKV
jgi:O-antigen/teichoic acid export membrane protein